MFLHSDNVSEVIPFHTFYFKTSVIKLLICKINTTLPINTKEVMFLAGFLCLFAK